MLRRFEHIKNKEARFTIQGFNQSNVATVSGKAFFFPNSYNQNWRIEISAYKSGLEFFSFSSEQTGNIVFYYDFLDNGVVTVADYFTCTITIINLNSPSSIRGIDTTHSNTVIDSSGLAVLERLETLRSDNVTWVNTPNFIGNTELEEVRWDSLDTVDWNTKFSDCTNIFSYQVSFPYSNVMNVLNSHNVSVLSTLTSAEQITYLGSSTTDIVTNGYEFNFTRGDYNNIEVFTMDLGSKSCGFINNKIANLDNLRFLRLYSKFDIDLTFPLYNNLDNTVLTNIGIGQLANQFSDEITLPSNIERLTALIAIDFNKSNKHRSDAVSDSFFEDFRQIFWGKIYYKSGNSISDTSLASGYYSTLPVPPSSDGFVHPSFRLLIWSANLSNQARINPSYTTEVNDIISLGFNLNNILYQ